MIGPLRLPFKSRRSLAGSIEQGGSAWDQALARAADGAADDGFCLFLEEREGLIVAADSATVPAFSRTRSLGLAARGPFDRPRSLYLAQPAPEDVAVMAGIARGDAVWSPDRRLSGPLTPLPTQLDSGRAADLVSEAIAAATLPGSWVEALWVAFRQQVVIARGGRSPVRDLRAGERIRITVRIARGARSAAATVEAVHPKRTRELVEVAARRAEARLDAGHAPDRPRNVVLAPGVGGIVAHELIGHALEADVVLAGDSWLAEFEEKGRSDFTVVDDPRRGRAAWSVDDEGEAARATPLLRSGRVTGRLHDLRSARDTGLPPTGHGRRSSFREEVMPRMGCTFVSAGGMEPQEVVQSAGEGIYVRRMESAGTDAATGRAFFRVTDADLVAAGRIDRPLHPHVLVLDGSVALRSTHLIANDLSFDTCIGSCHRDGQALSTSVGAPTICIGSASVIT